MKLISKVRNSIKFIIEVTKQLLNPVKDMEKSKLDKNKQNFKSPGTFQNNSKPSPNSDENLKNLEDYIERHSEPERVRFRV